MKKVIAVALLCLFAFSAAFSLRAADRPVITVANAGQITNLAAIPRLNYNGASFAWSPDGSTFAADVYGGVQLYDFTSQGIQPGLLLHAPDSTRTAAFTPDGSIIAASAGVSGVIWMWDAHTGQLLATLDGDTSEVEHIAFSPDGKWFVSNQFGAGVIVWGLASGQPFTPANALRVKRLATLETGYASNLIFTSDSRYLLVSSNSIAMWDMTTRKQTQTFPVEGSLYSFALASDDHLLAYGGYHDKSYIGLLNLTDQSQQFITGTLPTQTANDLAFNPDSTLLAAAYENGALGLWDVQTQKNVRAFGGAPGPAWQVAFSPDGTLLATLNFDDAIRIWGLGDPITVLPMPTATVGPTVTPGFSIGSQAIVLSTKGDKLNVRSGAGISFDIIAQLPPGTTVTIVDGPQQADGFRWWKIRTDQGIEGWVVEHAEDEQTLGIPGQ